MNQKSLSVIGNENLVSSILALRFILTRDKKNIAFSEADLEYLIFKGKYIYINKVQKGRVVAVNAHDHSKPNIK